MNRSSALVGLALVSMSSVARAEELKLPPEVTPALRARLRKRRAPFRVH